MLLAERGDRLVDLLDDARRGASLSCRSANCGVCAVAVTGDVQALVDATADELRITHAKPGTRLACQIRFAESDGRLRLRFLSPDFSDRGH